MFEISFLAAEGGFTAVWLLSRAIVWKKQGKIVWKREAALLLMYVNLAAIIRFVFFPKALVNGHVQPLIFDPATAFPFRVNLVPLVHLFEYDSVRDIVWNVAGNTAMFVPGGIVLPILNTLGTAIGYGIYAAVRSLKRQSPERRQSQQRNH